MIYLNYYLKVEEKDLIFRWKFFILSILATVCCHSDLEIVSNLTHAFVLLLFDRTLYATSITDQEFQQQTFIVDFLVAKK